MLKVGMIQGLQKRFALCVGTHMTVEQYMKLPLKQRMHKVLPRVSLPGGNACTESEPGVRIATSAKSQEAAATSSAKLPENASGKDLAHAGNP